MSSVSFCCQWERGTPFFETALWWPESPESVPRPPGTGAFRLFPLSCSLTAEARDTLYDGIVHSPLFVMTKDVGYPVPNAIVAQQFYGMGTG